MNSRIMSNGGGSYRSGPARVFALLEIVDDRARIAASNDSTLRGRTIEWIPPEGHQLSADVLQALDMNVAVHRPFKTVRKAWVLVCGARGNASIPLEELIDDWTLQLVQQIAEQQDQPTAAATNAKAEEEQLARAPAKKRGLQTEQLVLCFQPIFDVTLRRATRAEALLRYQSREGELQLWPEFITPDEDRVADGDRWVMRQVLKHAGEWSERHGIRNVHVNLVMHDDRTQTDLLDMLRAATPRERAAIAVEINGVTDYAAPRFVEMVNSFADAGATVGIELASQTALELALLRGLPLRFVKVHVDTSTAELAEVFGWDVFATRVQVPPQWELLRQHGVKFAQGYALEPPLTIADFENWIKARIVPRSLAV